MWAIKEKTNGIVWKGKINLEEKRIIRKKIICAQLEEKILTRGVVKNNNWVIQEN